MKNRAPLQSLAIALLTATVVVSATIADGHAAKIRKNTVKRIATEQEFRDLVAGRKMSNKYGYFIPHKDGSLTGTFDNSRLTGTWSWEGKFFCRTAKFGNKNLGLDCLAVAVSGDKVTFTRKKGKGKKVTYRLQAPES